MSENQELIYAVETATVALERIAAALEVIAGAKPISKIIGEELAKDPEFLMGVPEVTQCVPKFHLSKCTHTVYNCAVKLEEAPAPLGFTQCTALLSEAKKNDKD